MQTKVDAILNYFSTNGTLEDLVRFTQLLAAEAWGEISKLYHVVEGVI